MATSQVPLTSLSRLIGEAVAEHHLCAVQRFAERVTALLLAARPQDDSPHARGIAAGLEMAARITAAEAGLQPAVVPAEAAR